MVADKGLWPGNLDVLVQGLVRVWFPDKGWDYLEIFTDGKSLLKLDEDDAHTWQQLFVYIYASGTHTIKWVYHKDNSDSDGSDCVWLDDVVWTPSK